VLRAFYGMFESVSREDERSSPPQHVTPRTTVTFPAGSEYHVDQRRILTLLEQHDVAETRCPSRGSADTPRFLSSDAQPGAGEARPPSYAREFC
jgi:hypothetical protein